MVLRFQKGKLLDVTTEFATAFDKRIETLRSQLRPQDLSDFKNSDGKLQATDSSLAEEIRRLLGVKAKVLEIVWSYLYGGREQEAWSSLAELWPTTDADRIRESLLKARASGMRTQLDAVSIADPRRKKGVQVFNTTPSQGGNAPRSGTASGAATSAAAEMGPAASAGRPFESGTGSQDPIIAAVPILIRIFPTEGKMTVSLVIDSAGKVRSATPSGRVASNDNNNDQMNAISEWKFVPAFKDHLPVASSMVRVISLQQ
jgi:hypothetical protein